jgi:hypothetical protein
MKYCANATSLTALLRGLTTCKYWRPSATVMKSIKFLIDKKAKFDTFVF